MRERRDLYAHQQEALDWAEARKHPAFFLEMRLGKTLTAIRACEAKGCERVLVVSPLPVIESWEEELAEEGIPFKTLLASRIPESVDDPTDGEPGFFLTSYSALTVRRHWADDIQWDAAVLDESVKIRNPKTNIAKIAQSAFKHVPHRMILSGLPNPEKPTLDLATQFIFLLGDFMGARTYWNARELFFDRFDYDWFPKPGFRRKIRDFVQANAFIRTRKDVGLDNVKVYQVRRVDPGKDQARFIREAVKSWQLEHHWTKWRPVVSTWEHMLAGGFSAHKCIDEGKVKELINLLTTDLADQQVVVWFRFNRELAYVWHRLRDLGISVTWITGKVGKEQRAARRRLFQKGKRRVALLQLEIGKYGNRWDAADTAVYYSNSWSLDTRKQSEDRIASMGKGKDRPLLFVDLVTRGSIDEEIIDGLRGKLGASRMVLGRAVQRFLERMKQ